MFSDFTWKKYFCSRKWWGGAGVELKLNPPPRPFMAPFLYGPDQGLDQEVINSLINIIIQ